MKKKNVLVLASLLSVTLACSTAFVTTKSARQARMAKADCAHEHVEHYKVHPTTSNGGRIEHWACCDCGTAWFDEARTQEVSLNRNELNIPASTAAVEINKNQVAIDDILNIVTVSDKTKGLDQTDWGVNLDTPKSSGTYKYYEVDGRNALKVSATGLNDSQRALIQSANSGFSEWRFEKATTTDTVTFDYKYWDVNTEKYQGGPVCHLDAQFVTAETINGTKYQNASMELINDNAWHSMTVTGDQVYTITHFLMKIYHFEGELYISNLVIGDTPAFDFSKNVYGTSMYSVTDSTDVSGWGNGYQGGGKLNRYGANSIAYTFYGLRYFEARLPRIDYRRYSEVTYDLESTKLDDVAVLNSWEFRIGFSDADWIQYAGGTAANAEATGGKLTIIPFAGKLVARISNFQGATNIRAQITDADVISGKESLVLRLSSGAGDGGQFALLVTNLTLKVNNGLFGLSKIAECAGNDSFTGTDFTPNVFAFSNLYNREGIDYGQNFFFKNVDLDQYDTLVFGVHIAGSDNNTSYAYFFSGGGDGAIVWNNAYAVMKLQKNSSGTWDTFYKEYHILNGDWVAKIGNLSKSNFNAFSMCNWATGGDATVKIGLTELYAK